MLILNSDNNAVETDESNSGDDVYYCALDMRNPKEADFYFHPLYLVETFTASAIVMKIGGAKITLPFNDSILWHIVIGDKSYQNFELLSICELNGRDFTTPVMNPLTSFIPDYEPIEIVETYENIGWTVPKIEPYNILAVPLEKKHDPRCMFLIPEVLGKKLDVIDASLFYK